MAKINVMKMKKRSINFLDPLYNKIRTGEIFVHMETLIKSYFKKLFKEPLRTYFDKKSFVKIKENYLLAYTALFKLIFYIQKRL